MNAHYCVSLSANENFSNETLAQFATAAAAAADRMALTELSMNGSDGYGKHMPTRFLDIARRKIETENVNASLEHGNYP